MPTPAEYSFTRYLSSKRTVDDRALNLRVWESLRTQLARTRRGAPYVVLEIGAGIGTMVERMLEDQLLPACRYVLLDSQQDNLATAAQRLAAWTGERSGQVRPATAESPFALSPLAAFHLDTPPVSQVDLFSYGLDLFDFLAAVGPEPVVDLLIAHAFIDLVDVPTTLQRLKPILARGALLYLTINFDGVTTFQPEIDPVFDAEIETLYHATMDHRLINGAPSGDSHTGRHLFAHLKNAGIQILDAGSSDWVVFSQAGVYPADEAYFLHFIVHTLDGALRALPELDAARFAAWVAQRHAQIEAGELVYIAHQLDALGRWPGS